MVGTIGYRKFSRFVARLDTISLTLILALGGRSFFGSAANANCFLTIEIGVDRGKRIITR